MFWYAFTIFLSSFLLFQVQPIIAKMILPWFGGTAAVWNTCMLFFQLTLLAGYAYAHLIFERTSARRQCYIHVILLVGALALLPILPGNEWKPTGSEDPVRLILGLLIVTLGLPYFVLSTTGPLLQAWYAKEFQGVVPYRLFALSNAASLMALMTYPVLVEPNFDVMTQAWIWSGCFMVFVGASGVLAWRSRHYPVLPKAQLLDDPGPKPTWTVKAFWVLLAAIPSVLMLTVTTYLTQDIAVILPLDRTIGDLSPHFILCFEFAVLLALGLYLGMFSGARRCLLGGESSDWWIGGDSRSSTVFDVFVRLRHVLPR